MKVVHEEKELIGQIAFTKKRQGLLLEMMPYT